MKEACFVKLEFLWEGWLIQNLKCFLGYRCFGDVPPRVCKIIVKLITDILPKIVPLNIVILVV